MHKADPKPAQDRRTVDRNAELARQAEVIEAVRKAKLP
jgi:hypothetical protein